MKCEYEALQSHTSALPYKYAHTRVCISVFVWKCYKHTQLHNVRRQTTFPSAIVQKLKAEIILESDDRSIPGLPSTDL